MLTQTHVYALVVGVEIPSSPLTHLDLDLLVFPCGSYGCEAIGYAPGGSCGPEGSEGLTDVQRRRRARQVRCEGASGDAGHEAGEGRCHLETIWALRWAEGQEASWTEVDPPYFLGAGPG